MIGTERGRYAMVLITRKLQSLIALVSTTSFSIILSPHRGTVLSRIAAVAPRKRNGASN